MKRLILRNSWSPGDVVLLTAAIRDLHRSYRDQFLTDVRTPYPGIWQHNPYVSPLDERDREVEVVDCEYPLINLSNVAPCHAIHGFMHFLNQRFGLNIKASAFKGDIHLSEDEKSWDSQVHELIGDDVPFWIVVAGGKNDVTIKWWEVDRYQEIVNHFNGTIQFVQVGAAEHHHPKLQGVVDLRGKTDLRQLIRLVYHAQGVLCPVTLLMHLAAAVDVKPGGPRNRACVVVAGGREPCSWEAYPHHQFIHTNGALLCCDAGGCWKSRTVPLGDGDERDRAENLCFNVVKNKLPRCMDMITATDVIRRIEVYFQGGAIRYLNEAQSHAAKRCLAVCEKWDWDRDILQMYAFKKAGDNFVKAIPIYPAKFKDRGIVICAGGITYFTSAWVCIKMLRHLGCSLPIQLWHLGKQELDAGMEALVEGLAVECVDALELRQQHPARILNGFELKPYAIIHSPFKEVLLLDADNVPVVNPEFLFETSQFKEAGAIFWPDYGRLGRTRTIWKICGVPYRDEPEFESGQILVDKQRCWEPLCLAMWYNEHSDCFYEHIHGDKDTYHMAFRRLEKTYSMPSTGIHPLNRTMCQHDFSGNRIFQHRNLAKWKLFGVNQQIFDFRFEAECLKYLAELRGLWNDRFHSTRTPPSTPTDPSTFGSFEIEVNQPSIPGQGIVHHDPPPTEEGEPLTIENAKREMDGYICRLPGYPGAYEGRGIVICGGGLTYFTCAWVCVKMLRQLGCSLPIEIWYRGKDEMSKEMEALLTELGVKPIDSYEVRKEYPARILNGYELKPYAIIHSSFKEVLLLDADNVPIVNPEFLFGTPQFHDTGAVFWPDFGQLKPDHVIWRICGVPHREEAEFESGQILIDKEKCWRPLSLAMWLNEHSDFYYQYIHGDKDTFHLAFRKLEQPFSMPTTPVRALFGTLCQHDFEGRRIFQHRNGCKWVLKRTNKRVSGFLFEEQCFEYLQQLETRWYGRRPSVPRYRSHGKSSKMKSAAKALITGNYQYRRIGYDQRRMSFLPNGKIGVGAGRCEAFWDLKRERGELVLLLCSQEQIICRLTQSRKGCWEGRWITFEMMPVELVPLSIAKIGGKKLIKKQSLKQLEPRKNRILFRAPLTSHTGYGLHACQIVTDLQRFGYELDIRAVIIEENFAYLPDEVRHNIVCQEPRSDWELLLHPPGFRPTANRRTVYFTMWESTRLAQGAVHALNQADCVIVPSKWNASCFNACGVEKPIRIIPLGINTDVFHPVPMDINGPCIFGTAGRFESGGVRKGIGQVTDLFQKAFPRKKDVFLEVKIFPDCDLPRVSDTRVRIIREFLTEVELAAWFSKLTCFVSAAKGEGWGLMQHQALATGRPLIGMKFGGVAEFFTDEMGFPVDFQLEPADGFYAGCGFWAKPSADHMVGLMRHVYRDRKDAFDRGAKAAAIVKKYSWENSNRALLKILQEIGMVT